MDILFYLPEDRHQHVWLDTLQQVLPQAKIRVWTPGDHAPADYALVFKPHPEVLQNRQGLKAIFNLAAGVDPILAIPDLPNVPIVRLEDTGMAIQMAEYVTYAVLQHFRSFDTYDEQTRHTVWLPFTPKKKSDCRVGILGMGILGKRIAESLLHLEFPVSGWSRHPKSIPGVKDFVGQGQLTDFIQQSNILVCALPLTDETRDLLNYDMLSQLPAQAYFINIGRGHIVVEDDLLALIKQHHLSGATLDVFREEPLPPHHPFWKESRIHITPHISAYTLPEESVIQIAEKIVALEKGQSVSGVIDRHKGY